MTFTIIIPGVAAPQGSKRHVGRGRLVEMSKRLPGWRQTVAAAIAAALPPDHTPIDGPVRLTLLFTLPRPRAATGRPYPHKNGPGDLDKLVRGVCDAITASRLWTDDSLVCSLVADKMYVADGDQPAVQIIVTEL